MDYNFFRDENFRRLKLLNKVVFLLILVGVDGRNYSIFLNGNENIVDLVKFVVRKLGYWILSSYL